MKSQRVGDMEVASFSFSWACCVVRLFRSRGTDVRMQPRNLA